MKLLVVLIAMLSPIVGSAQKSTPEIEKALYEVNVNGETAYYTDLHCSSALFTKDRFYSLQELALQKEGVFHLEYLNDGKTIRIAHLSYVEAQTLKEFGTSFCENIELAERELYSF